MITYIFRCNGVDLCAIVQESHTTLSINSHSSYILGPMPTLKGVWIQEGSLLEWLYALGTSIWRFFGMVAVVRGVQAHFFDVIPSLPFNCGFTPQSLHKWTVMDKMFQATTVIAALLCLGILYSPCQVHHKFLSNPNDSIRIFTSFVLISSSTFFLQVHQNVGLVPLGWASCL